MVCWKGGPGARAPLNTPLAAAAKLHTLYSHNYILRIRLIKNISISCFYCRQFPADFHLRDYFVANTVDFVDWTGDRIEVRGRSTSCVTGANAGLSLIDVNKNIAVGSVIADSPIF